jgi:hypothetical protein
MTKKSLEEFEIVITGNEPFIYQDVICPKNTPNFALIETIPSYYQLSFESIRQHKDGRVNSIVTINRAAEFKTDGRPHIIRTNINMRAGRSISELAGKVAERDGESIDKKTWERIIEDACNLAIELIQRGEPMVDLSEVQVADVAPEYLIEPLVFKGLPNIIYGEGGTTKSLLAMTCCLICSAGLVDNPLEMKIRPAISAYLDYEFDKMETAKRLIRIQNAVGTKSKIFYRRCTMPLIDDVDRIHDYLFENKVQFVVIDSLGLAAGSDNLKETKAASDFYTALGQLGDITSLIIAHPPRKSELNGQWSSDTNVYGSVFFTNLARNVYEIKKEDQQDDDNLDLILINTKNNLTQIQKPISLHVRFARDSINIYRQKMGDVPEFEKYAPMKDRVCDYLKCHGRTKVKVISKDLNSKPDTVSKTLLRLKTNGAVILFPDNTWAMLDHAGVNYGD